MAARQDAKAQTEFQTARAKTPRDYASNLRMAQCLQAQGQTAKAANYADNAREIYPQEAQAYKLAGVLALQQRDGALAYQNLDRFDRLLPGDAGILFLKGVSLEGMGNRRGAAQHYAAYLRQSQQGNAAQYSYNRLKAWGVVK